MQDSQQGPDLTFEVAPAQRRDQAFADWVGGSADALMRTALFLTGDRHAAEDLLQDSLERTYLHWPRVQEPAAYARTVMVRAVTDRWRRQGRRPREVTLDRLDLEPGSHPHIDDTTARYAAQDEVVKALSSLSSRQRAVLVLRYYEDWTEAQIADALNCSTGTVKTQASRGLARLRQLLGPAHPASKGGDVNPEQTKQSKASPTELRRGAPLTAAHRTPAPLTDTRTAPSSEEHI